MVAHDLLAFTHFSAAHRRSIYYSTNPVERLNREIGRRANEVGIRTAPPTPPAGRHSWDSWPPQTTGFGRRSDADPHLNRIPAYSRFWTKGQEEVKRLRPQR